MFERFTDGARRVVVLAQEEAKLLNHNYIGTEHILLGLLGCDHGNALEALAKLDVSLEAVREQVEDIIGRGMSTPSGHIPFTPRAKKVLELALREALQVGASYIGTEHILLGLIREGEGVAAQVLIKLGLDLASVRAQVLKTIGWSGSREHFPASDEPRTITIELPPGAPYLPGITPLVWMQFHRRPGGLDVQLLGTKQADIEIIGASVTYRDATGAIHTNSTDWSGEERKTPDAPEPTPEPGEAATN